ncbi:MAG: hypothetical protein MJ172_06125 [Clostridia bacterium]|nr:hypothetical protein [Clostridia bacterium]
MKRLIRTIPVFILCAGLFTGCDIGDAVKAVKKTEDFDAAKWCQEVALEGYEGLMDITGDEDYLSFLTSDKDFLNKIEEISDFEIDEDELIEVITIRKDTILDYVEEMSSIDLDDLSEVAKEKLIGGIPASIGNIMNSDFGGVDALAVSSMTAYSKNYTIDGEIDDQVWIIRCGDDEGLLISFINTGDSIVTVTTQYVVLPEDEDELDDFVKRFANKKDIEMIEWN